MCAAVHEPAWQQTPDLTAGSTARGFLPSSPAMHTSAHACPVQGASTSLELLTSAIRTGFTGSNYSLSKAGTKSHRLSSNTKSYEVFSFLWPTCQEKLALWQRLNVLEEDRHPSSRWRDTGVVWGISAVTAVRTNILWLLIILIKVVLLFVWMFMERNTDFFPIVLLPDRSWRSERGQVCNMWSCVLLFLKYSNI